MTRARARIVCIVITALIADFVPADQLSDKRSPAEALQVKTVSAWLAANAVRCDSDDLYRLADLQPLKNTLKGLRVIGVGEATHGTHEFFRFRHRLLVFLVRQMGFRTLALETGYASAGGLGAFVRGEAVDITKALAQQGLWTWDTEEMRGILDWLRKYKTYFVDLRRPRSDAVSRWLATPRPMRFIGSYYNADSKSCTLRRSRRAKITTASCISIAPHGPIRTRQWRTCRAISN